MDFNLNSAFSHGKTFYIYSFEPLYYRTFPYVVKPALNLLNELRNRCKMRGFLSNISLFRNKFYTLNYTGVPELASVYHMILKSVRKGFTCIFCLKTLSLCHRRYYTCNRLYTTLKYVNH